MLKAADHSTGTRGSVLSVLRPEERGRLVRFALIDVDIPLNFRAVQNKSKVAAGRPPWNRASGQPSFRQNLAIDYSCPGKPTDNAHVESLDG
jgi:hypothetical protein